MPAYDVQCSTCGKASEIWGSYEDMVRSQCSDCGGAVVQKLTGFARTRGQWGGDTGYYDRALGTYVENYRHRDKIMKERGLCPADDSMIQDHRETVLAENVQHEKEAQTFSEEYKKTGSFADATAKTFSHSDKWSN